MNGYAGKILRLNVTERKVGVIPTSKYQHWMGGHGLGSAIFFDLVKDKTIDGFDSPRMQSLLAYLILHHDAPQSRAHIAYQFWPDSSDKQAMTNLRYILYTLRRTLPEADAFLDITTKTLQWRVDAPFHCDVVDFCQGGYLLAQPQPLQSDSPIPLQGH